MHWSLVLLSAILCFLPKKVIILLIISFVLGDVMFRIGYQEIWMHHFLTIFFFVKLNICFFFTSNLNFDVTWKNILNWICASFFFFPLFTTLLQLKFDIPSTRLHPKSPFCTGFCCLALRTNFQTTARTDFTVLLLW
mgnify:CR=1 FL=1